MSRSNSKAAVLTALLPAMAVAACMEAGGAYSSYRSIGSDGWQREDTLHVTFAPIRHGGRYAEELGLRTNSRYPFMEVVVIVGQEARPSGFRRTDTLDVRLTDDKGHATGEGISHYQYLVPMPPALLGEGDTLRVSLRHNMMRSPLKGITDAGITLKHTD